MPRYRKNQPTSYNKFVYLLIVKWKQGNDDVFVFSSKKKAKAYIFEHLGIEQWRIDEDDYSLELRYTTGDDWEVYILKWGYESEVDFVINRQEIDAPEP